MTPEYQRMFERMHSTMDPIIRETFPKIEMEEAQYQDSHNQVNDATKKSATYTAVAKQHDELVARTTKLKADYEAWNAYYEAHKQTATQDEQMKLKLDSEALQKEGGKIHNDYALLRVKMEQLARESTRR